MADVNDTPVRSGMPFGCQPSRVIQDMRKVTAERLGDHDHQAWANVPSLQDLLDDLFQDRAVGAVVADR